MQRLIELKNGDELDEYLVEEYLGQGESKTAKAYITKDDEVIKLFILDKSDQLFNIRYEKFKNEAAILKLLENSQYVLNAKSDFRDTAIHNAEQKEAAYYVMERMEGNLRQLVLKEDLSLAEKLDVINQIILAMIDFHKADVCHRDLYAPNVLYRKLDEGILCKVADFGSAKQLNVPQVVPYFFPTGNLQFTSPESVAGLIGGDKVSKDILSASDNFSLGLMMYEILTAQNQDNITATLASLANLALTMGIYNPATDGIVRKDFLTERVIPIMATAKIDTMLPSVIMSTTETADELNEIMMDLLNYDYAERLSDLQGLSSKFIKIKSGLRSGQ